MFDDPECQFFPVRNDEDQYSLWPADRDPPAGWFVVGPAGDKAACLAFIEATWVDLRPRTLREAMAAT